MPAITIAAAGALDDIAAVRALFEEYADWLQAPECMGEWDAEMAEFPDHFRILLLARQDGAPVGAVGLKEIDPRTCEMKRLYRRPAGKGWSVGKALAQACLIQAAALGYRRVVLDTLPRLTGARAIYEELGFREIPPFVDPPECGVLYLGLDLAAPAP